MALEKFRPNVLIFAANLDPDLKEMIANAAHTKTRLVVLAETGENGHA